MVTPSLSMVWDHGQVRATIVTEHNHARHKPKCPCVPGSNIRAFVRKLWIMKSVTGEVTGSTGGAGWIDCKIYSEDWQRLDRERFASDRLVLNSRLEGSRMGTMAKKIPSRGCGNADDDCSR